MVTFLDIKTNTIFIVYLYLDDHLTFHTQTLTFNSFTRSGGKLIFLSWREQMGPYWCTLKTVFCCKYENMFGSIVIAYLR